MSAGANALPPRGPAGPSRDATATIGMAIFLGAVGMLFAALFFAYAVMRAQAPAWPPVGVAPLPRGTLGLNTLVLVAASLALRGARGATRRDQPARARLRVRAALALGAAFLAAQVTIWHALATSGAGPGSGIYGSVFFAFSGLHALHVAGGLVALALIAARGAGARGLGACVLYWDFVLVVWLLFYVSACLA